MMTATTLRSLAAPRAKPDAAALQAKREKQYIWILVGAWALSPFVRRVVEWASGLHAAVAIDLLPMVVMVPIFWQLLRKHRFGREMNFVMGAWLVALGYGLYIALVTGNMEGGLYDLSLFLVPMFGALWAINASLNRRELFETLAKASLTIATIVSVYGLYQFAAPPPWDVQWVSNADLYSIGRPVPYELRIFSTLNSPATLATFLVFSILSSLHRLTWRTYRLLLPLAICAYALLLTLVRAGYLGLGLGIVVYLVSCTHRRQLFGIGIALAALIVFLSASAFSVLYGGNSAGINDRLTSRLSSLNDVQNDPSALDRERQSEEAVHAAVEEPLGHGLGSVGTAAQLSSSGQTAVLDNGYLSRWLEFGIVGFPAYLAAVFGALFFTFRRWVSARRGRAAPEELNMLATSIAAQVAIIGSELAGDAHSQLSGLYFWVLVGLSLKGAIADVRVAIPWSLKSRAARFAPSNKTA